MTSRHKGPVWADRRSAHCMITVFEQGSKVMVIGESIFVFNEIPKSDAVIRTTRRASSCVVCHEMTVFGKGISKRIAIATTKLSNNCPLLQIYDLCTRITVYNCNLIIRAEDNLTKWFANINRTKLL